MQPHTLNHTASLHPKTFQDSEDKRLVGVLWPCKWEARVQDTFGLIVKCSRDAKKTSHWVAAPERRWVRVEVSRDNARVR